MQKEIATKKFQFCSETKMYELSLKKRKYTEIVLPVYLLYEITPHCSIIKSTSVSCIHTLRYKTHSKFNRFRQVIE